MLLSPNDYVLRTVARHNQNHLPIFFNIVYKRIYTGFDVLIQVNILCLTNRSPVTHTCTGLILGVRPANERRRNKRLRLSLAGRKPRISPSCMPKYPKQTSVEKMGCRLFGTKPSSEPMLCYCLMHSSKQISVELHSNYNRSYPALV